MKLDHIIELLKDESTKSNLQNKHACIAIQNGKLMSPTFHNYMRTYVYNYRCDSMHAEMATINYIINSLTDSCKKSCIL